MQGEAEEWGRLVHFFKIFMALDISWRLKSGTTPASIFFSSRIRHRRLVRTRGLGDVNKKQGQSPEAGDVARWPKREEARVRAARSTVSYTHPTLNTNRRWLTFVIAYNI